MLRRLLTLPAVALAVGCQPAAAPTPPPAYSAAGQPAGSAPGVGPFRTRTQAYITEALAVCDLVDGSPSHIIPLARLRPGLKRMAAAYHAVGKPPPDSAACRQIRMAVTLTFDELVAVVLHLAKINGADAVEQTGRLVVPHLLVERVRESVTVRRDKLHAMAGWLGQLDNVPEVGIRATISAWSLQEPVAFPDLTRQIGDAERRLADEPERLAAEIRAQAHREQEQRAAAHRREAARGRARQEADATGAPAKARPEAAEARERQAASQLRSAKDSLPARPDTAKRRLRELVEAYPGTDAAAEAKRLLAELAN